MKFASLALAAVLLSGAAQAQTAPEAPTCFPGISGFEMQGPQMHYGRYGFHLLWACKQTAGSPARRWAVSCRHDSCLQNVWEGMFRELTTASGSGISLRYQIARRYYSTNVLVNCKTLLETPQANVLPEQVPDYNMCWEQNKLLNEIYPAAGN